MVYKILFHGWTCKFSRFKNSLFLFLLILLMLLFVVQGASESSNASLAISVSIVEGDIFGPGDSFHSITEIRNSEASGRVDVVVTYEISDEDGHSVMVESTTVAIETLSSFSEELQLPDNMEAGVYVLKASVTSLDGSKYSEASRSFRVVVVTESEQRFVEYIMTGALMFTGGALVYEHRRISKLKVSGKDLKRFIGEQRRK